MCPPCVIWTTHMLWCVCFMSFRNYLYRPVSLQVCDSFVCLTDSQFCEAMTWSFYVWQRHGSLPLVFCFSVGCRSGSLVLDKYDFIFDVVLEWGVMLLWSGSACVFEVLTGSPVSFCVVSFSNVEFFSPTLHVLCVAPKCTEILLSSVMLKISQAVNVSVLAF